MLWRRAFRFQLNRQFSQSCKGQGILFYFLINVSFVSRFWIRWDRRLQWIHRHNFETASWQKVYNQYFVRQHVNSKKLINVVKLWNIRDDVVCPIYLPTSVPTFIKKQGIVNWNITLQFYILSHVVYDATLFYYYRLIMTCSRSRKAILRA